MSALLKASSWAVVGSHGKNPIATQLVQKLQGGGKKVAAVNPGMPTAGVLGSLKEVKEPIEGALVDDMLASPSSSWLLLVVVVVVVLLVDLLFSLCMG